MVYYINELFKARIIRIIINSNIYEVIIMFNLNNNSYKIRL